MSGVNKVILLGNLGNDVDLRYSPTGQPVASFSVATSEKWKDKQGQEQNRVEWSKVVVWGKLGELCNQYLKKGSQVYIEGQNRTRSWEKDGITRYTTEVIARTVQFVGNKVNSGNEENQAQPETSIDSGFTASDIPF